MAARKGVGTSVRTAAARLKVARLHYRVAKKEVARVVSQPGLAQAVRSLIWRGAVYLRSGDSS